MAQTLARTLLTLPALVVLAAAPASADPPEARSRPGDAPPRGITQQITLEKVKLQSLSRVGSGAFTSRTIDFDVAVKNPQQLAISNVDVVFMVEGSSKQQNKAIDLGAGAVGHARFTAVSPDLCKGTAYYLSLNSTDTSRVDIDRKLAPVRVSECTFTGSVEDPWSAMSPDNASALESTNVHISALSVDHAPVCGQNLGYHATVSNPTGSIGSIILRVFDTDGTTELAHHGPFTVAPHGSAKASFASTFPGYAGKMTVRIEETSKTIPAVDVRYHFAIGGTCKVDFAALMTPMTRPQ